ncbi:MAG: MmcQ/YjbR family DNA-binding protein [Ignavibacteriaceae bacterium]|nr:MmcQ/YjbR family DNA-binding protein [Ignavibacteriaceae bacterium]
MTLDFFESYSSNLKGVTSDIKWENNLCFMVKEKIFLLVSLDDRPHGAAIKVSKEDFYELTNRDGITQAPHFAKEQWIKVTDPRSLTKKEWEVYIKKSYDLVAEKLPAKIRKELGK